jgi:hypothetical protein
VADFGCDTSVYRLSNVDGDRTGIVFYAKRDVARRGFVLGVLALREFHRRHPEFTIHLFGDATARVPFPAVNHGTLTPARLAALYNECAAGIAMSFTNVSLVPEEMLACGAVPVAVDSRYARAGLSSPYVRWAQPTPGALASALSDAAVKRESTVDIAASVRARTWESAQQVTLRTIEDEVYG